MTTPPRFSARPFRLDSARTEADSLAFEIRIAETILATRPDDDGALSVLGHAYTRAGRHDEALRVDRRLTALYPKDPLTFYNLACSLSNLGQAPAAFAALDQAIALGYREIKQMLEDPDLEAVRRHPQFAEWLAKHRRITLRKGRGARLRKPPTGGSAPA